MNELVTRNASKEIKSFREKLVANPRRGLGYHELAVAFVTRFAVGTKLKTDALDAWVKEMREGQFKDHAGKLGLYIKPEDVAMDSDAHKAYLQRRNELRYNLNKAAEHPRMYDSGVKAFSLRVPHGHSGELIVTSPETAIAEFNLVRALEKTIHTKKAQLLFLQQSVDYENLGDDMRGQCEQITDAIEDTEYHLRGHLNTITKAFHRFTEKVAKAVAAGAITSQNGGIRQLVDESKDVEIDFDSLLKK